MNKNLLLLALVFLLNTAHSQCPTVNAGPDISFCMESELTLNGIITGNYTDVKWVTAGSGVFSPSNSELQTSYVLSETDKQSKYITLILVATNSEGCYSQDSILITTSGRAVVSLGKDITPAPERLILQDMQKREVSAGHRPVQVHLNWGRIL